MWSWESDFWNVNLCRENNCMIELMEEFLKPFSWYMVGVELNATLMTLLKEIAALFLFVLVQIVYAYYCCIPLGPALFVKVLLTGFE